jgi:hypothetical protein
VYKENNGQRWMWFATNLPSPMRYIDVTDLVIYRIEMETYGDLTCANLYVKEVSREISWERLSEIATKSLHKLHELDYEDAIEFFKEELDLSEEECAYFEVTTETETHLTCEDCPYHWTDEGEAYPSCHYNGDDLAPCEYEDDNYNYDYEEY